MTIRHVIRPASISATPRLLARALNATTRRYPGRGPFNFSFDFFMVYPQPIRVGDVRADLRLDHGRIQSHDGTSLSSTYSSLYEFYSRTKPAQRASLRALGLCVPETATSHTTAEWLNSGQYIVRPLRHSGGRAYRVTNNPTDFIEGQEYIQRVYPKDREYRVIYCCGDPIIIMRKKNPNSIPADQPWNHANGSYFQTINNIENCQLNRTNFFYALDAVPIITSSHIVAIDVMWSSSLGYSICELNTCPGLTIDNNLRKVATHAASHCGSSPSS